MIWHKAESIVKHITMSDGLAPAPTLSIIAKTTSQSAVS